MGQFSDRGNARCSSQAHWKALRRLPISAIITFFRQVLQLRYHQRLSIASRRFCRGMGKIFGRRDFGAPQLRQISESVCPFVRSSRRLRVSHHLMSFLLTILRRHAAQQRATLTVEQVIGLHRQGASVNKQTSQKYICNSYDDLTSDMSCQ